MFSNDINGEHKENCDSIETIGEYNTIVSSTERQQNQC